MFDILLLRTTVQGINTFALSSESCSGSAIAVHFVGRAGHNIKQQNVCLHQLAYGRNISFHLGNVLLALLEKNMVKHNTFEINSGRCQHCKTISRTNVTHLIDNITSIYLENIDDRQ